MEETVAIVVCSVADFEFLAGSFEEFSIALIDQFELPADADVQLQIDENAIEGSVDVFLNGEVLGSIIIQEEAPVPLTKEKRVLH